MNLYAGVTSDYIKQMTGEILLKGNTAIYVQYIVHIIIIMNIMSFNTVHSYIYIYSCVRRETVQTYVHST